MSRDLAQSSFGVPPTLSPYNMIARCDHHLTSPPQAASLPATTCQSPATSTPLASPPSSAGLCSTPIISSSPHHQPSVRSKCLFDLIVVNHSLSTSPSHSPAVTSDTSTPNIGGFAWVQVVTGTFSRAHAHHVTTPAAPCGRSRDARVVSQCLVHPPATLQPECSLLSA